MKLMLSIVILLTLSASSVPARMSDAQLRQLADEATELFSHANAVAGSNPAEAARLYDQAILRFRGIIEEGAVTNEHIYYNLANAYLLKGDVGRAILNYRRAQRYGSSSNELLKNLSFARNERIDRIAPQTQRRVLQTLFFWHYDFSPTARLVTAAACWILCCLAATLLLWLPGKRALATLLVIAAVGFVTFGSSLAVQARHERTTLPGVIVTDSVVARQGDGVNYPESFTEALHSGTEFDLLESRRDWLRIRLVSGIETWIHTDAAEIIYSPTKVAYERQDQIQ